MPKSNLGGRSRLVAGAFGLLIGLVGVSGVSATGASAATTTTKGAKVVSVATRAPVGKMLVTVKGLSLYIHPSGPCTGGCLNFWPALVLPAGKTKPLGAKCLATTPIAGGQTQVTYDSQPLYTFVEDSGTSLNGNGDAGFEAATLVTGCA